MRSPAGSRRCCTAFISTCRCKPRTKTGVPTKTTKTETRSGVEPERCSWRTAAVSAAHGVRSPRGQFARQLLIHHSVSLFRCGKYAPPPRLDGVSRRDGGGPTAWLRLKDAEQISALVESVRLSERYFVFVCFVCFVGAIPLAGFTSFSEKTPPPSRTSPRSTPPANIPAPAPPAPRSRARRPARNASRDTAPAQDTDNPFRA